MKQILDISYGTLPAQQLDLYLPDAAEFPVFVYYHGGGLQEGSRKEAAVWAPALAERGIAVVSASYRMYPQAAFPDYLFDAAAAIAWAVHELPAYGTPNGIYVGGSSAGGYLTQMLCFDPQYLAAVGLSNADIAGYYHDAGQGTVHSAILQERGIDPRRSIVDAAAPLFHVDETPYPPMEFVLAEHDMPKRAEQTMLTVAALADYGHDMRRITVDCRPGYHHYGYTSAVREDGSPVFADMVFAFIRRLQQAAV